jgi:hypothetical protein
MANIPRVTITVFGSDGRVKKPLPSNQLVGAFEWAVMINGWWWLMMWLCRYCLMKAEVPNG